MFEKDPKKILLNASQKKKVRGMCKNKLYII